MSQWKTFRFAIIFILGVVVLIVSCVSKRNYRVLTTVKKQDVPEFELPPPQPSATYNFPSEFLSKYEVFGDLEAVLNNSLNQAAYARWSYYYVQNGFAVATQLEKIEEDGSPCVEAERWEVNSDNLSEIQEFSIRDYITSLFKAEPGYYRCIVFVVTSDYFTYSTTPPSKDEALEWIDEGSNRLPKWLASQNLTSDHRLTALIYEFKKLENSESAKILIPSKQSGKNHLEKSKLYSYIFFHGF